jgi:hypothetical protein
VLIDPSNDPLAAVFLVAAASPWTLVLSALVDRAGELPAWFNLLLLSAGILVNAAVLHGVERLLAGRRAGGRADPTPRALHGRSGSVSPGSAGAGASRSSRRASQGMVQPCSTNEAMTTRNTTLNLEAAV